MARLPTSAKELATLLEAAPRPIYVLDDQQTIVFCNQACLDWVGQPAEELLGRRCAYHSSPEVTGADAVAAGLCPPPGALTAGEMAGTVACSGAGGRLRRRRARFLSLGAGPEDAAGLWVIVGAADLPETEPSAPQDAESESAWLHEHLRRFRQQAATRYQADRLVGESLAMRRARAQIGVAIASNASVLVTGPPGSGRQHAARVIHYAGHAPSRGSLVPLACSLLGAELIQSTVSALAARHPPGQQARRSTLLLNDVDGLPAEAQADLAGMFSARSFPLRLISTASRPLLELAREGEFREDLASMLSTIAMELPPLSERRQDLPLLAQALVEEANIRGEKQLRGFSPEALDLLDAHAWPGNIDELVRVVAEAHQHAEGPEIGVADLPRPIHLTAEAAAHPRRVERPIALDEYLARVQRELVRRALAQAKGNKAKAARLLGMSRPRLYRRLVQLGLEKEG